MKNRTISILLGLLAFVTGGCEDMLDRFPKDKLTPEEKALKDAMRPKFGKSLGKAAVAQRLAASPKSASLRKTSKNNPINKGKRVATRNKPKGE